MSDLEESERPQYRAAIDKWDAVIAMIVWCVALIIYIRTLSAGLLPGDSGEFQTLSYLWGHTHPTGYPVYITIGRLFGVFPFGDLAYRINLLSAVMAALAVSGLYVAGRQLTPHRGVALVGALALALSTTFWSQALIAEVYTAGVAFLVWILVFLLWWDGNGDNRALFAAGLLGGLSLGVHMSVALLAPAVALFLLAHRKRGRSMWLSALGGAALGVTLTVGLFWLMNLNNPTAGYFNSVIDPSRSAWDMGPSDIDGTVEKLWFGWSARQFQSFLFGSDQGMVWQAADYWANLPGEISLLLVALAAAGAIALALNRRAVALLLLVGLVTQLFYTFNYAIWDIFVFYLPSYVTLLVLAVAGAGALIDVAARALPVKVPVLDLLLALTLLVLTVWPRLELHQEAIITAENPFQNLDGYPVAGPILEDIARATILALPDDAIVLTDWDMMWPYYYAAQVTGERPDLMFVETQPADDQDSIADSLVVFAREQSAVRPLFVSERLPELEADGLILLPLRMGPTRLWRVDTP